MNHYTAIFRIFRFQTSIVALALVAACGGKAGDSPADSGKANAPLRVALLTPGPISDQAWNSVAYGGLVALRDSLGAQISNIQTKTPAEFDENFRQYGAQGYSIVIGHGFEFQDAAVRVAPSYPKTVYIVTSGRVTSTNVAGMSFLFEEASYQAGIIAGAVTKTNIIGLLGGTELPPVKASFTAFARGARAVNPNVKVITSYVGNWDDVSAGKEQALAQIARGVDVLFQNADAAGLGAFKAARDKKIYVFGANANQNAVAPDVVLGSVVIDLSNEFIRIGREVQNGTFKGRVITLGVKDDVVRLVLNPTLIPIIPASAIAKSDSVGAMLRAGTFHALDDILQGADTAKPIKPLIRLMGSRPAEVLATAFSRGDAEVAEDIIDISACSASPREHFLRSNLTIPAHSSDRPGASVALRDVVRALDTELRTADIPEYPGAMNGLQVTNDGQVTRVAVAVDASLAAVAEAAAIKADLLIVHHGLFWSGAQPVVGVTYQKYRALFDNNIAVYSTHLPLDAHPTLGNNVRLAETLGLAPSSGFGRYKTLDIAVAGECDIESATLVERMTKFSATYGGSVRTSIPAAGRRTRNWAIVTGGGASSDTLTEARVRGIDTLIVGEGPHHTTVEAQEHDLLIIYAGHYATETLGVQALGSWLEARFGLPWSFLHLPTGS